MDYTTKKKKKKDWPRIRRDSQSWESRLRRGNRGPGGLPSALHAHRPWSSGAQRCHTQSPFQTSALEQPVWVEVPQKTLRQRHEFTCRRVMIPRGAARAWVAGSQFRTPDGEGLHHSNGASRGSHHRLGPHSWSGKRPEAQGGHWGWRTSFCGNKCSGDASNISRVC